MGSSATSARRGRFAGASCKQQHDAELRQTDAEQRGESREHEALGEQLADDREWRAAHRGANRELAFALRRADEKQVRRRSRTR